MTFVEDLDAAIASATSTRGGLEAVVKAAVSGADEIIITEFHESNGTVTMRFSLRRTGVPSDVSKKLETLTKLTRGTR